MRRPDIPVLTTLRFPAAFAIVLFHFLVYTPCPHWVWEGFTAGVSFFYVLSGFILYYNYVDLTERGYFWIARFARVWPVHIFTLVLILCVLPWGDLDGHASWELTLPANILLLHAWLPFQGSTLGYNGVSWSLSVEAFFYLFFPLLLGVMKKRGAAGPLGFSFVLGMLIVFASGFLPPANAAFVWPFDPPTRLFEFVLGMAACRWWLQGARENLRAGAWTTYEALSLLVSVGLVIALPILIHDFGADRPVVFWLGSELSAAGFAALIWTFAHQGGVISRILSGRVCEWFGEISFALYMCHQIILRWLNPHVMHSNGDSVLYFLPYLAASLVVSAAIFHFVETPARHVIVSAYKRRVR
jgi:peptidoglycan/LPS O-acetylase OafA/YrhL